MALAPPTRRLPFTPQIQAPDYLVRALLTRDGFKERWGSTLGRAPLVLELPERPTWWERMHNTFARIFAQWGKRS